MMEKDERITIRIPAHQAEAIDGLVISSGLRSRSDLIRKAIDDYLRSNTDMWNAVKMTVQVPRGLIRRLDALVDGGDVLSREYAIHEALSRHIEHYEDYYLNRKRGIKESRKETEALERSATDAREDLKP